VNRSTFNDDLWDALRNIHLICSGKVFVRTRTAFWKDGEPAATLNTTITDEAIRAAYLFDFDDTPSGVICLSYTWGDSAIKFSALNHEERVQLCLAILAKIYGRDLISAQVMETVSFAWQEAKGYHGAFKLTYPGQYEYQQALFRQPFDPPPPRHNGVFLAGETTSWAGGWIEGALHSGLDAARAVIARLGGVVHSNTNDY
jgi:monoamine oxidase